MFLYMTLRDNDSVETMIIDKSKILKVLIIDDELDICYLLSGILRQKKLRTSYVNTLSDAEVALKNDTPGLLFLDNHLPDGVGLDFIQHIKTNYPETKIIMITAHDSAADRKKAFMQGADFFISKPFTRELIYNTLDKII
jgi:two-component system OmpR family response regulator